VEIFDPFDLDIDDVYARLSFAWPDQKLPADWKPWNQPRGSLPIDKFISELIDRCRAPKLRPAKELLRHHHLGLCPYAVARAETARAALNALLCVDTDKHRANATTEIMQAAKELPVLRSQIAAMVNRFMLIIEAQEYAFEPALEDVPLVQQAENLSVLFSELQGLEGPLTRLYVRRSQNSGNLWRMGFVGSLFSAWWKLTGRDPSTTKPFTQFLDAAWQTITEGKLPDLAWESAIETARSRARREHGSEAPWRLGECLLDPALTARGISA
jgi:hypothetical protein